MFRLAIEPKLSVYVDLSCHFMLALMPYMVLTTITRIPPLFYFALQPPLFVMHDKSFILLPKDKSFILLSKDSCGLACEANLHMKLLYLVL